VPYRLLPASTTLFGAAGSLENILAPLASGALCWVIEEASLYSFDASSLAAVAPPNVIATARGAGAPGRWIRVVATTAAIPFTTGFWVDRGAPDGGNGSAASPFNTVTAAVAAAPTSSTILILPGDYSAEDAIAVGSKTLTFFGLAGQDGLSRVTLPGIGYASGGTSQQLAFRHVSTTITRTGPSTTGIYLDYCPSIILAGAGNATQVISNGDFSCVLQGEGGQLYMRAGFIGSYTANSGTGISLQNVGIAGHLVAAGINLNDSDWTSLGLTITSPLIFWDLTTAARARALGVTTSSTPLLLEAHNANDTFTVAIPAGTSDVAVNVAGSLLAGVAVGDAVVASWAIPGPAAFGAAAIGGCQVTATDEVTIRFVGVTGGGNRDIILSWLQSP